MKILITGASGYVGGTTAKALADAGHEVLALARSDRSEEAFRQRGWSPVRGDLHQPSALSELAAGAEAVVHAAKVGGKEAGEIDSASARAILSGLEGSGKPFLYTSGVWVLGDTGGWMVGEDDPIGQPAELSAWRRELEPEILAAKDRGIRTVVIRPGVVYGQGGGLPGMLARGELPVVGDGRQRWPLVHADDLGDLYHRALEAPAGSLLHGIDGWAAMIELALAARVGAASTGAGLSLEIERMELGAAREKLGAFADALALDQRVSSDRTRRLTGWSPAGMPAVEELMVGSYARGSS